MASDDLVNKGVILMMRHRDTASASEAIIDMVLADLKAKVDGLPVRLTDDGVGTSLYLYVKRADVLALLEEAGQ